MSRSKPRRLWRYEVDEVDGFESYGDSPPVKVGDVLIDGWKSDRTWRVYDFKDKNMPFIGMWHCKLLGEYDGPRNAEGRPVSVGSPDAV